MHVCVCCQAARLFVMRSIWSSRFTLYEFPSEARLPGYTRAPIELVFTCTRVHTPFALSAERGKPAAFVSS